jgi:hypothetical protein
VAARQNDRPPARNGLPATAWNKLLPIEKLQVLYGLALDRAHDALRWTDDELDAHRLAYQNSVRHDVLMLAQRWAMADRRSQERAERLGELAEKINAVEVKANGTGGKAS